MMEIKIDPLKDVSVEGGRTVSTSREPWLQFRSIEPFAQARFVELVYRSSLFDDPVRPILKFVVKDREITHILPGPVMGAGVWRGVTPRGVRSVLISPCARSGRFDFSVQSIRALGLLDMAHSVWRRRPKMLGSIAAATIFGYHAEAENAFYWGMSGAPLEEFDAWRAERERPLDLNGFDTPRAAWAMGPNFLVLIENCEERDALLRTQAALAAQAYQNFRICLDAESAPRHPGLLYLDRTDVGEGFDLIISLRAGDELADYALALVVEEAARNPDAKVLYADEIITAGGGAAPHFKPDWCPVFESQRPYLGRALFLRSTLANVRDIADLKNFHQLARAAALRLPAHAVAHLRRPLLTRAPDAELKPQSLDETTLAFSNQTKRISVILLTRDHPELLRPCLDSILRRSTHNNFELLIVDNGTRNQAALAMMQEAAKDSRVRVTSRPGPFNFAALNNEAARAASGDILVFLNNDTEIVTPDWLERLSRLALMESLGAIGALLLYPSGLVQHAGVVVGLGQEAGHFEALRAPEAPSWLDRVSTMHETAAVTAACLAIERRKFDAVAGFDENRLPIEFNDIDLCLRLREKGWPACYAPDVKIVHKESATRGRATIRPLSIYSKEREWFCERWRGVIRDDPYFHPGFSLYARRPALS